MIYFSWNEEEEDFSQHLNNREDEKVFHLEIFQKEKEYAHALITIGEGAALRLGGQRKWMWISWKNEKTGEIKPLFKGMFSGLIKEIKDGLSQLELVANPSDGETQLAALQEERKTLPSWDELFVREELKKSVSHFFDGFLGEFYADRVSHRIKNSHFFEGIPLEIGGHFTRDSLRMERGEAPFTSVHVNVHAQWVQKDWAMMNIFPRIARSFKQGFINSLTGLNFVGRWPKSGRKVGRSGIRVLHSSLEEFRPRRVGGMSVFTNHTAPYHLEREDGQRDQVILPRYWYQGKLFVEWVYKQKRHETLSFELHNSLQTTGTSQGSPKIIDITLQNIYPPGDAVVWHPHHHYRRGMKVIRGEKVYEAKAPHRSNETFEADLDLHWIYVHNFHAPLKTRRAGSFFLTPRGKKVAEASMLLARRELAKSARAVRISFQGAWEDLSEITTDHQVFLEDERLPKGRAQGKVTAYKIVANGKTGERFVDVTLESSIGAPAKSLKAVKRERIADPQVVEEEALGGPDWITLEDLAYRPFDEQRPTQGILNGNFIKSLRFVRGVQVKNSTEDQLRALSHVKTYGDMDRVLKTSQTTLRVHFFDIRTRPCLRHAIRVQMKKTWAPPAHIELD